METKLGHNRKFVVTVYEALGTALFAYCILVSGADAIAGALALFAMIIIFGDVTGGHFNPAVTLGVLVWQFFHGDPISKLIFSMLIIVGQCVGALGGALLATLSLRVNGEVPKEYVPILAPEKVVENPTQGVFNENFITFFAQTLCTFVFVSVILILKGHRTGPTKDGIHVALTVALVLWGLITLDYHTGACFNPAIALGQTFFQIQHLSNDNQWLSHYFYAYTGGPALGGILSGLFFLMHEKCHNEPEEHHEHDHGSRVNSEAHGLEFDKRSNDSSYRGLGHDRDSDRGSRSNRSDDNHSNSNRDYSDSNDHSNSNRDHSDPSGSNRSVKPHSIND